MSVIQLDENNLWTTFPNSKGMVLAHGERLTMYYIEYEPNMTFPEHSHPQEQVGYCIKGEGEFGIGDKVYKIMPGCGYHIPSNVVHYEKNTGNTPLICVDIFNPVREDLFGTYFDKKYFKDAK